MKLTHDFTKGNLQWPIDWDRNSLLLNKGIEAVETFHWELRIILK